MVDCPGGEDESLTVCSLIRKKSNSRSPDPSVTHVEVGQRGGTILSEEPAMGSYVLNVSISEPLGDNRRHDQSTTTTSTTRDEVSSAAAPLMTSQMSVTTKAEDIILELTTHIEDNLPTTTTATTTINDTTTTSATTTTNTPTSTVPTSTTEYVTDDYNYEYNFGYDEYDYLHYNQHENSEHKENELLKNDNISSVFPIKTLQPSIGVRDEENRSDKQTHIERNEFIVKNDGTHFTPSSNAYDKLMADATEIKSNKGIYEVTSPKVQVISCSDNEFDCGGGWCVPSFWLCDGHFDCHEGEDEDPILCDQSPTSTTTGPTTSTTLVPPTTPSGESQCSPEEWRCPTGHCIPQEFFCDGVLDCPEGFDEVAGCSFSDIIDYDDYLFGYDYEYNLHTNSSFKNRGHKSQIASDTKNDTNTNDVDSKNSTKHTHVLIPKLVTQAGTTESDSLVSEATNLNDYEATIDGDRKSTSIEQVTDKASKPAQKKSSISLDASTNKLGKSKKETSEPFTSSPISQNEIFSIAPETFHTETLHTSKAEIENNKNKNDRIEHQTENSNSVDNKEANIVRILQTHRDTTPSQTSSVSETKSTKLYPSELPDNSNIYQLLLKPSHDNIYQTTTPAQVKPKFSIPKNYISNDYAPSNLIETQDHKTIKLFEAPKQQSENSYNMHSNNPLKKEPSVPEIDKYGTVTKPFISVDTKPIHIERESEQTLVTKKATNESIALNSESSFKNSPEVRISLLPPNTNTPVINSSEKGNNVRTNPPPNTKNTRIIDIPVKTNGFLLTKHNESNSDVSNTSGTNEKENRSNINGSTAPFFQTSVSSSFSDTSPTVTFAASTTKDGQVIITTRITPTQLHQSAIDNHDKLKREHENSVNYQKSSIRNDVPQSINTQINLNSYFYTNTPPTQVHKSVKSSLQAIERDSLENCTIIVAIQGGASDGSIPEYIIHDKNGESLEYKVVSVIDQPINKNRIEQQFREPEKSTPPLAKTDMNVSDISNISESVKIPGYENAPVVSSNNHNLTLIRPPHQSLNDHNEPIEEIIIITKNTSNDQDDLYDNEYQIGNKEMGAYQYDIYKEDNSSANKLISEMYNDEERPKMSNTTVQETEEPRKRSSTELYNDDIFTDLDSMAADNMTTLPISVGSKMSPVESTKSNKLLSKEIFENNSFGIVGRLGQHAKNTLEDILNTGTTQTTQKLHLNLSNTQVNLTEQGSLTNSTNELQETLVFSANNSGTKLISLANKNVYTDATLSYSSSALYSTPDRPTDPLENDTERTLTEPVPNIPVTVHSGVTDTSIPFENSTKILKIYEFTTEKTLTEDTAGITGNPNQLNVLDMTSSISSSLSEPLETISIDESNNSEIINFTNTIISGDENKVSTTMPTEVDTNMNTNINTTSGVFLQVVTEETNVTFTEVEESLIESETGGGGDNSTSHHADGYDTLLDSVNVTLNSKPLESNEEFLINVSSTSASEETQIEVVEYLPGQQEYLRAAAPGAGSSLHTGLRSHHAALRLLVAVLSLVGLL